MRLISAFLVSVLVIASATLILPQTAKANSIFDGWESFFHANQEIKIRSRETRINRPSATSTPTPDPTAKPTTAATQKSVVAPTSGSTQSFIMNGINEYRKSQGLSTVQTDSYTCDFAKTRAQEITGGFNHNGFTNRINSKSLPYPGYHLVTENIAMTSNYKDVVNMWINSAGHAENMRKDTPYVCVEQNGNYFAYEGWKP